MSALTLSHEPEPEPEPVLLSLSPLSNEPEPVLGSLLPGAPFPRPLPPKSGEGEESLPSPFASPPFPRFRGKGWGWGLNGSIVLVALLSLLSGCASFHKGAMPGEPKDATFATIRGARVRYVDKGDGPPVVLVHGFASAIEAWSGVIPELSKTHRVIALDLKGFGWTDRPEGDYSPEEEARIVLELMTQRGIDKAALVAHSWGSSIALAAALSQPARVSRLALYDAWVYEEQLPTFFHWAHADGVGETLFAGWYSERPDERIAMAFYDKRWVTEALVESVEDALERPGTVAAALAGVRGMHYAQTQDKYRTIKIPTLLMWGREDQVTTLPFGERLSRELPQSKLIVYPLCGHFPMIEALAASNADLSAFLAEEPAVVAPKAKDPAASDGT